jgi:pantothenate kinase type III
MSAIRTSPSACSKASASCTTGGWRAARADADELGIFVTRLFEQTNVACPAVDGIAVASVVPPLTRPIEEMCERYFRQRALLVDATNAGIPITYSPATDVGADRLVNAVAAREKYGKGAGVRSSSWTSARRPPST